MTTQEEIAEKIGESQQTVANRLAKITKNGIYPEICKAPDQLRFGNKWEFSSRNKDYGMEGVTGLIVSITLINPLPDSIAGEKPHG